MRIALLADVHANLPALEVVLTRARERGVERFVHLGDLVGYYYWPRECLDCLRDVDTTFVQGNHDAWLGDLAKGRRSLEQDRLRYGSGLGVALDALSEDEISWLSALPPTQAFEVDGCEVLACHGAPWDRDTYIYPDAGSDVRQRFDNTDASVIFTGHTHYPMTWWLETTTVANPGSVGQPRNRQPGAHWLLWDSGSRVFEHRCEDYDVSKVVDECLRRDPSVSYLHSALTRT